jgi:L-histidine Nalpha-methyltransferase / hercynylcysteine S-oxide synthase
MHTPAFTLTRSQSHSNVPDTDEDWPSLASVLAFRDRVRERLMQLYDELLSGKREATRNIARTLVMTLEHEGFHVEVRLLSSVPSVN